MKHIKMTYKKRAVVIALGVAIGAGIAGGLIWWSAGQTVEAAEVSECMQWKEDAAAYPNTFWMSEWQYQQCKARGIHFDARVKTGDVPDSPSEMRSTMATTSSEMALLAPTVAQAASKPRIPAKPKVAAKAPAKAKTAVRRVVTGKVTAYTSEVGQTDSTPNVTASGKRTRVGVVANNCLPFGTKVKIAGAVYVVEDRMNSRYGCEWYDLWFTHKSKAIAWGVKHVKVDILTA